MKTKELSSENDTAPPTRVSSASASVSGSHARMPRGTQIGRYILLQRLGSGAMGHVYLAYDVDLDRQVAIKLLRAEAIPAASRDEARSRLLREAQAAAKLRHPNVVTVYEAGVSEDGQAYIAMEYVDGSSLRAWVEAARPWTEVLRVLRAAGEGLAAAHKAGFLHRDFKPDNVLIDADGTPKVADFGLARRTETSGEHGALDSGASSIGASSELLDSGTGGIASAGLSGSQGLLGSSDLDARLTRTGTVMGTPAYMAPEQHLDANVDERADQYAFCVAFYELLYGERPFRGPDVRELFKAKRKAAVRPPKSGAKSGAKVPRWLHRAVMKGLAPRAEERFVDMRHLLDELRDRPRRIRRGWTAIGLGGVALASGLAAALAVPRGAPCQDGPTQIAEVWNDGTRARLHGQFSSLDSATAEAMWPKIERAMDAYAERWVTGYTDACEATAVRGEQSDAALDRRMACLRRARTSLDSLVQGLGEADAAVAERATSAVAGLPLLGECDDADRLQSAHPLPDVPADAEAVADALDLIASSEVVLNLGDAVEAAERVAKAAAVAERLDYGPLLARVRYADAARLEFLNDPEAEALYRDTLALAVQNEIPDLTASSTAHLANLASVDPHRKGEVVGVGRVALDLSRHPDLTPADRVNVHLWVGMALIRSAQNELAEPVLAEASAIAKGRDLQATTRAMLHDMLGNVYQASEGKLAEAAKHYEIAAEAYRELFPPQHPSHHVTAANLGYLRASQGDYEVAEQKLRGAVNGLSETRGPADPFVVGTRKLLGSVLADMQRYDDALETYRQVDAAWDASLGPKDPKRAEMKARLAGVQSQRGEIETAEALFGEALAFLETIEADAREPTLSDVQAAYGKFLTQHGSPQAAVDVLERALVSMTDRDSSPGVPYVMTQRHYGEALVATGRIDEGINELEAALAAIRRLESAPRDQGDVELALSNALALRGDDEDAERARSLKIQARKHFEAAGPYGASRLARLDGVAVAD